MITIEKISINTFNAKSSLNVPSTKMVHATIQPHTAYTHRRRRRNLKVAEV